MATLQNPHPQKSLLPPLKELCLEIQVHKLINDYLFSSSAEERSSLLDDSGYGSLEFKQNNALPVPPAMSHAAHMVTSSACNAPCMKPTVPLHEHHRQPSHEAHCAHTLITASTGGRSRDLYSVQSCDMNIKVREQSVQCSKAVCNVGSVTLTTIHNEGGRAVCLSRADTFPCTSNGELQLGVPFKGDTEMKASSKKPPLPPKLPNVHSNKLDPSLKRCFSDTRSLSQSLLRTKLDKKKKSSSSSSSAYTSLWAFFFTFCFAVIMISQGFWSQSSAGLAAFSTNPPSSVEELMKVSSWGAQEVGSSEDMLLADRKAAPSRIQRVKRELQPEHVSDMKRQSDLGT